MPSGHPRIGWTWLKGQWRKKAHLQVGLFCGLRLKRRVSCPSGWGVSRGAWTLYLNRTFSRSWLDDQVPFDPAGVLVQLASSKPLCLDRHVFIIGERKLIVDDDADGLGFPVVDGDLPFPVQFFPVMTFVLLSCPSSLRLTWMAGSRSEREAERIGSEVEGEGAFLHEIVFEIDAEAGH